MKTLSEVVNIVGMSRRVIQEYEKAGLSQTPSTTNKYGHLLYDEKTIERLCQIRFYRDLGYNKKQIKDIFSGSDNDRRSAVISQIDVLEKEKKKLEALIAVSKASDKLGWSVSAVRSALPFAQNVTYDMISSIFGDFCRAYADRKSENCFNEVLTEEERDELSEAVAAVLECFGQGISAEAEAVQEMVERIHNIASKALSDSMIFFSFCNLFLSPDSELAKEFDGELGKGCAEYLFSAVRHYCVTNADSPADRVINEALEKLERFGRKKYAADSEEVQNEVRKLYGFYENIAAIAFEARLELLHDLGKTFENRALSEQLDDGDERELARFISEAIYIFCDGFDKKCYKVNVSR
ncbi:MAG: MerR family transcriptional regulator [Oscillospiraceae bacterium]|nr:MerR family transcriptional regulator [Oscillospiraceae bacterium]